MAFIKRLGWYLLGLSVGMIFLVFFFKKKSDETGVDFCYLPNCRVLKDMRSKNLVLSNDAKAQLLQLKLDTTAVTSFLNNGKVDFSQSDTNTAPCKKYVVKKDVKTKEILMDFSSCDSTLTLTKVYQE